MFLTLVGNTRHRAALTIAAIVVSAMPVGSSFASVANSPRFSVDVETTAVGAASSLRLDVQTNDTEPTFRNYAISISPSWRFAVGSMRASAFTSCGDLIAATNPSSNAEAVGMAQLLVATDATRAAVHTGSLPATGTDVDRTAASPPALFTGQGGANKAALWFLRWNSATSVAKLCGKVITTDPHITQSKTIVFEVDLKLGSGGSWLASFNFDAAPGAPDSTTSITDNPYYTNQHAAIPEVTLDILALSGGNYNINPVTGQPCPQTIDSKGLCSNSCEPCRVSFSMTPTVPEYVLFAGDFSLCPAGTTCSTAPAHREVSIAFHPDTDHYIYQAAHLTAPTTTGLPADWALVRGTKDLILQWSQPAVAGSKAIRGYVVDVAQPRDQVNQHFEYIVTQDPTTSDFDARQPCGADGKAATCSLTLTFPLSTTGGRVLDTNGAYDVALITIYTDGSRTDQLCDNGTPQGVQCAADHPIINVPTRTIADGRSGHNVPDGVSIKHIVLRDKAWPAAYGESGVTTSGGGFISQDSACQNSVSSACGVTILLVDFTLKVGEVVDLSTTALGPFEQGFVATFVAPTGIDQSYTVFDSFDGVPTPKSDQRMMASSNTILGDNAAGGLVSFSSADIAGHEVDWRFDGAAGPTSAQGMLTLYDPKGLTAFAGLPVVQKGTFWSKAFNGARLT